jgi:hypothetical protein
MTRSVQAMALAVWLLGLAAVQAQETGKPLGKWERKVGKNLMTLVIEDGRLHLSAVGEKFCTIHADYSMTRDGVVFGVITSVECDEEEDASKTVKGHEPLRGYGTPTVTSPTGSLGTPEAIFPTLPDRACPLQALHFHDGRRPPSRPGAWPCTTQAATLPCPRRVKRRRALQACNPTEG